MSFGSEPGCFGKGRIKPQGIKGSGIFNFRNTGKKRKYPGIGIYVAFLFVCNRLVPEPVKKITVEYRPAVYTINRFLVTNKNIVLKDKSRKIAVLITDCPSKFIHNQIIAHGQKFTKYLSSDANWQILSANVWQICTR